MRSKVQGHETTARKIAYQVALCYQIGFAIERNEARSNELLKESEYAELDLSLLKAKSPKYPHDDSEWLTLQHLPSEGFLEKQNTEKAISQLSQEARDLSLALGNGHTLTLNVRNQLAYLLGGQGRYNECEKVSQQIMDTSLTTLSPESLHTLGSMGNLGVVYTHNGRLDEAEKIIIRVIETLDRIYMPGLKAHSNLTETLRYENNPYLLTCLNNLADIYRTQERWQEAEMLQKKAFDIASATLGADHPKTLQGMVNIAATYYSSRRLDEAEELYLEVLKSPSGVLSAQHPFRLTVEANLAYVYSGQGHHEKAIQLGMQALDARLKLLGPAHEGTLISMDHMTNTFRKSKQWEKAKEMCMQLIETSNQILGAEHAHTLDAMVQLMKIYFDQERWTEAERLALQVVNARRKLLGAEHLATVDATSNLAEIYIKQGRWKEAEDLHMHVIEIRKRLLGIHHHNTLACMGDLVLLYISCGQERLADAEQLAFHIMETSVRILGSSNHDTLISVKNLATVYQKQGRQDEALNLMESIKQLGSKADHPDTLLSEHIPQAQKTSQNNDPLTAKPTDSFRPRVTPFQSSSTLEQIKRTRHFLRRKEKGLPLKPL
ncbi:hypothetical protein OEA41_005540 [Lepraria neglecta]|uniref:Kinesin light chain n=1 Tax=Lepraria neglecta TaxID=209136 RepID=A0AAE0DFQ1_9LECA|nr:hypothetical protein OEA41_005540 [Lepraria neglecta]